MRKGHKEKKKVTDTSWENKERKKMRGMKMRIITYFGDRTRSGAFLIIVSVSRTDDFMNIFNGVISPRVFSYRCVLHYFLITPVGFSFNLTYGLKPRVSGIKIATGSRVSIFQVEWLIATLIICIFFTYILT